MPRLGDDANVASAYPNRMPNLRGGWLKQFVTTALGTLLLLLIMNNIAKKDYKDATKQGMVEKGVENKIDKIIPKTEPEKRREAALAKKTAGEKLLAFQYEIGNLTNSVVELQQHLVNSTGTTLKFPAWPVNETENAAESKKGDMAGDGGASVGGGGEGGRGGDSEGGGPAVGLRGAADAQQQEKENEEGRRGEPKVEVAPDGAKDALRADSRGEGGGSRRLVEGGGKGDGRAGGGGGGGHGVGVD